MPQHAAVIGSGPNGLTAAVRLAQAGWQVTIYESGGTPGGGARSSELFGPGLISDLGASVMPFGSPAYAELLTAGSFRYAYPEIPAAHPLETTHDDADAVLLHRSLEETAEELGADAGTWRRVIGPVVKNWHEVQRAFLAPPSRPFSDRPGQQPSGAKSSFTPPEMWHRLRGALEFGSRRSATLAQIGMLGLPPAQTLMRSFREPRTRALFAGMAAHSTGPLNNPLTAAVGIIFAAAGHAQGWPVIRGGTQKLVDALTEELHRLGGVVITDFHVEGIKDVPLPGLRPGVRKDLSPRGYQIEGTRRGDHGRRRRAGEEVADVVVLDLTPKQALQLTGLPLTNSARRRMKRWQYGPGAVKIDYLVDGPIPWSGPGQGSGPNLARAGTVHLGGSAAQIAASEAAANKGVLPGRPYVLLAQPSAADDSRTPDSRTTCWAYAHVPNGLDAGGAERAAQMIESEICRFAPDFRESVLEKKVWTPAELEQWNPNLVGGSLSAGLATLGQTFAGPASRLQSPYFSSAEGVYLCSASTPPGGGAHGMAGYHAAGTILRDLEL